MQWGPRGVAEEEGFEPSVQLPIRHISNVLVSATHPLLRSRTAWRRERDSNPRSSRLTVFKTAGLNHSPIPPKAEKNRLLTWRMQDYFDGITGGICLTAASVGWLLPRSEHKGRRAVEALSSAVEQPTPHERLPGQASQWKTQP